MNVKMKFTVVVFAIFSALAFSQNSYTLKGTVTAASDNMPIPGVNVLVLAGVVIGL